MLVQFADVMNRVVFAVAHESPELMERPFNAADISWALVRQSDLTDACYEQRMPTKVAIDDCKGRTAWALSRQLAFRFHHRLVLCSRWHDARVTIH